MGSEIRTSETAASQASSLLETSLEGYCSFGLISLALSDPVAGSRDHDGRLAQSLRRAMEAFGSLVHADAHAITNLHATLATADEELARSL